MPDLPGVHLGIVRAGAGSSPERDYSLLSPFPLRGGEAIRFLDHEKLPGELRDVRRERDLVQSRERETGRDVRDPEDHHCGSSNRAGIPGQVVPREP